MSLRSLTKRGVALAFKRAGDLKKTITLVHKTVESFDFANYKNLPNPTPTTTRLVQGFLLSRKKKRNGKDDTRTAHSQEWYILVKAEDIAILSDYDHAMIDGARWNLVPPFENNEFIAVATAVKED